MQNRDKKQKINRHLGPWLREFLALASRGLRALGKSVESRTQPVSSRATLARDSRQMHLARVYSRHYTFPFAWYTVMALSSLFLLASDNTRNLRSTCIRHSLVFIWYVQKTYFRCISFLTLFLRSVLKDRLKI